MSRFLLLSCWSFYPAGRDFTQPDRLGGGRLAGVDAEASDSVAGSEAVQPGKRGSAALQTGVTKAV